MITLSDWMSYEEAGQHLGLSTETVRHYCRKTGHDGKPVLKRDYVASQPLVSRASVEDYEDSRNPVGNPTFGK